MPSYDLYCAKCKIFFFDEKLTFAEFDQLDNLPCKHCHTNGTMRVQINDIAHSTIKEIKTIGQQAEFNAKLKGKYFASEQEAKAKEQEAPANWTGSLSPEHHKKIIRNPNKAEAKRAAQKYVLTGK